MRAALVAALAHAVPATLLFALALPPLARIPYLSAAHVRAVGLFAIIAFVMAFVTFGARVAAG